MILLLCSLALITGCKDNSVENNQQTDLNEDHNEKVIVEMDAGLITEKEFVNALKDQYGEEVLTTLIQNQVISAEAEKIGIDENDIQAEIQYLMDNLGVSNKDHFNEMMKREGLLGEEDIRNRVLNHLVMQHRTGLVGEVTEEELLDEYEKGEALEARHILVEDEETALEVLFQLEEGRNFSELVHEYSKDPSSLENDGELGNFRRGTMTPPFEEAAFNLDLNEKSEPVKTQFGYHIIETTGRIPFEDEFEEVREQLRSHYNDQKLFKLNQEKKKMMEDLEFIIHDPAFEDLFEK